MSVDAAFPFSFCHCLGDAFGNAKGVGCDKIERTIWIGKDYMEEKMYNFKRIGMNEIEIIKEF